MASDNKYIPGLWLSYIQKSDIDLKKICRMDIFKATGHGGQKKNKTSNAIRLTLEHLSVTYTASRSRLENISGAYKKLRMAMALDISEGYENRSQIQHYPKVLSQYFQNGAININSNNPKFPLVIGRVVDLFIKHQGTYQSVAEALNISNSQLRKFITKNPFMIETINKIIRA
ncbi:MAG: hypothetical protein H8E61_00565 [Bacteroidetes bacterium]|nr:hypothetical protein [Bacteroidota bacterium]